jgi:hypothetical protein
VVGVTRDLIADYLRELGTRLRTPDADLVLAEAEDHLRESVAAGLAIGMTEREAQEAAISAFGPVRAVVRAHHRRPRQLAADLVMAGLKLGWTGMFAIAASGFVALAMNHLFGRSFVGGSPATGDRYTAAQCAHWLAIWQGARTCAQAASLEASSDAVSLRVIGGTLGGGILLACYLLARLYWRRADAVLPKGLLPLAATAIFTTAALALVVCTFTGGPFGAPSGPGTFLSGAIVASAVAVASAVRARRDLRLAPHQEPPAR